MQKTPRIPMLQCFDDNFTINRWSLLEKYSCKASKLHLKPRRFKIFVEALVPYITTILIDAKIGAEGRKDRFDWLSKQLFGLTKFSICWSYAQIDRYSTKCGAFWIFIAH